MAAPIRDAPGTPDLQPSPEVSGLDGTPPLTAEALSKVQAELSSVALDSTGVRSTGAPTSGDFSKVHETLKEISDSIDKMVQFFVENSPDKKRTSSLSTVSSGSNSHSTVNSGDSGKSWDTSAGPDTCIPRIPDMVQDENDRENETIEDNVVLGVNECDHVKFRERIEGQRRYVLDFLYAGQQSWEEKQHASPAENDGSRSRSPELEKLNTSRDSTEHRWIQRVRINSPIVRNTLGQLANDEGITLSKPWERFQSRALTFRRPFSFIIANHKVIQQSLHSFRQALHTQSNRTQSVHDDDDTDKHHAQSKSLAELQCYVDFVEARIMPDYRKWRNTDVSDQPERRTHIRCDDLWYLFKCGDLVYIPNPRRSEDGPDSAGYKGLSGYQNILRISKVHRLQERVRYAKKSMDSRDLITISAYYIDFDGERWGSVGHQIDLHPFRGERDVTKLPVCPLLFMPGSEEILKQAIVDGKAVIDLIETRFGFYSGWSLINSPQGNEIKDSEGNVIKSPTHIESEVLVDYTEAFNSYPPWRPALDVFSERVERRVMLERTLKRNSFFDLTHPTKTSSPPSLSDEAVVYHDDIRDFQIPSHQITPHGSIEPKATWNTPSGESLALVPRRFYAYSIWQRKFLHLDIRSLHRRSTGEKDKAFNQLQISDDHKQLIRSLIQSHLEQKSFEEKHHVELLGQDLIRGKGKGLVFLFHGVPGVGKTATAEAVAQKWNRPLFPITCGDLGLTSAMVEKSLNEVFRLAHLWDCVLLLDEADVFITERARVGELQRNGLVSVFLRMLEYYNGILFLTTNRPGVLDEAVKSRVHLSLRFNHLDEEQTVKLFEFNIDRLKEIEDTKSAADSNYRKLHVRKNEIIKFARDHFKRYASQKDPGVGRWNGRQIRNAFLIAASLAHYGDGDEEDDGELQKQLNGSHFEKVDKTTLLYDKYRRGVLTHDDDKRAFEREER